MAKYINRRGYKGIVFDAQHLRLTELKGTPAGLSNKYLQKLEHREIPRYPRPEFHVAHLNHDTGGEGFNGIRGDCGFKGFLNRNHQVVWWSLCVKPKGILSAERNLLHEAFPELTEDEAQEQQGFLKKFATSPVFLETSRYGSYRFTFPLKEVLDAYSEQFCSGEKPTMRIWSTILYKQEVVYAVLVHREADQQEFSKYPLLTDEPDSICAFRGGRFIWKPEAICETHRFELYRDDTGMRAVDIERPGIFYVWDHVAIALHVKHREVLRFDSNRLRANIWFCEKGPVVIKENLYAHPSKNFDSRKQFHTNIQKWSAESDR